MAQNNTPPNKKSVSIDWLMRGSLIKIGDIFDRLTGRGWKPSSSLATSELTEKLKKLLDTEAKNLGIKGTFVPHNLKLKIQWDKFSLDSDEDLRKLEQELLTAIIDHINDNRYHTYAPLKLQIKADYFTEGVRLLASFDKFAEEEGEAAINLTVPKLQNIVIPPAPEVKIEKEKEIVTAEFTLQNKTKQIKLEFAEGERLSVGRTRDNALALEDTSVSKIHATLIVNSQKKLMVADTGSTNGTFINGKRIAYGKAFELGNSDKIKFGNVEVSLEYEPKEVPADTVAIENFQPESTKATEQFSSNETNLPTLASIENVGNKVDLPETAIGINLEPEQKPIAKPMAKPHITLKPLGQKPIGEKLPLPKNEEKVLTDVTEKTVPEKVKTEESPNQTAQGIVFDFGEEK